MYKKSRIKQKIRNRKLKIQGEKSVSQLLIQIDKTLHHYLFALPEHIDNTYKDPRRQGSIEYKLSEIVLAAVFMYMLRSNSGNDINEDQTMSNFKKNYKKLFKLKFPHMDTVNDVFKKLDEEIIEKVKSYIIKMLLSRRLFQKYKLLNKYIMIAIDGTGLFTYSDKEPYPGCPNKVSKTVKKTYFQSVVEAKIVGKN